MSFVSVTTGSVTTDVDTNVGYQAFGVTSDDTLVLTFNGGFQVKVVGYNDAEGTDLIIGRPVAGGETLNFYMWTVNPGGTYSLQSMSGNTFYTFSETGSEGGCFQFEWDNGTGTFPVYQDEGGVGISTGTGEYLGTFTQGTALYAGPVCFLAGTLIATAEGERAIESLQIGDLITTASGTQKPVKWAARMTVPITRFNRQTVLPICIRQGALGNGLPLRDLFVSNDHALAIDGVLVIAGVLVNGTTIVRCEDFAADVIEYFHVEVEDHDLLLAEGAAAETLCDSHRERFDNAAEFHALYPDAVPGKLLDMARVTEARQLPKALRSRFFTKAA